MVTLHVCMHTSPHRRTLLLCLIELHCMELAFQCHIMRLGNCHGFANNDKMWPGLLLTATNAHCMLIKVVGKTVCKGKYQLAGKNWRTWKPNYTEIWQYGNFQTKSAHVGDGCCWGNMEISLWTYSVHVGNIVLEAVPILEGSVENRERNCTQTHTKKPQNNQTSTTNSQRQPFMGEFASN